MTTTTATTTTASSTEAKTTERAKYELLYLDPAVLIAGSNVRTDLGDLTELTAAIVAHGVLEPITVNPDSDGGHTIEFGFRRTAAAVAAGEPLVPCVVRPAGETIRRIAVQIVENDQRRGLTVGERVAAYAQLEIGGLTATAIARQTGSKPAAVKKALTVSASATAVAILGRHDLTLEQAMVITEFEDDHDAVKTLTVTAVQDPGMWDHKVSRLRQQREAKQKRQAIIDELDGKGIKAILEEDRPDTARSLHRLINARGKDITPRAHANCPGHAVLVDHWLNHNQTVCLEPAANGHKERPESHSSGTGGGGKMTDEQKAERRTLIENNKAGLAAEPVRRAYVRQLLQRKDVPKGTMAYVASELLGRPEHLGEGRDELLANLLGIKIPDRKGVTYGYGRQVGPAALADATEARLPFLMLAQVAAAVEATMTKELWRRPQEHVARWLRYLASTGYTLAPVEQIVADYGTKTGGEAA